MNIISSSQNPIIKETKALKQKKHREERKLFCIEGIRFVEEALKEKGLVVKVFLSEVFARSGNEILAEIEEHSADTFVVSEKLLAEMTDTETPQGVMAVVRMKEHNREQLLQGKGFILMLDTLQDPGNLGTIIRTADAAGAAGVVLSKGCVDPYNPKVLRSTMGSIFHLPILQSEKLEDTIGHLKARGVKVYAADLKAHRNYFEVSMLDNLAVIIGNEANGVGREIAALADDLIKIPMPGKAESLNASIAAALILYESVRQRHTSNP